MLPEDLILQDRIKLYDNLARMGEYQGRLFAELQVYPLPRIVWEFEALGDEVARRGSITSEYQMHPLLGYRFVIDEHYVNRDRHDSVTPREIVAGSAHQAVYGDLNDTVNSVTFYLPNVSFQAKNLFGQERIEKTLHAQGEKIDSDFEGNLIDAPLDGTWHIRLMTRQSALEWLDEHRLNIGTQITTVGRLYAPMPDDVKFVDYPSMTLTEAWNNLQILSLLLSYVNGGYTGPLYIEGTRFYTDSSEFRQPSALVSAYNTTPLELTGHSWVTHDSDLAKYIGCFPTLKRMLTTSPWDEAFGVILAWYFQAIQPENGLMANKPWPIIANAVGTALERLSYTILVLEEEDPNQRDKMDALFRERGQAKKHWGQDVRPTGKRIQLLLERIGLSLDRVWDPNLVKKFIDVRNEATHPKERNINKRDSFYLLAQAIQWIDEILLWRLGYDGTYWLRTAPGRQSIRRRYDLRTRNPEW